MPLLSYLQNRFEAPFSVDHITLFTKSAGFPWKLPLRRKPTLHWFLPICNASCFPDLLQWSDEIYPCSPMGGRHLSLSRFFTFVLFLRSSCDADDFFKLICYDCAIGIKEEAIFCFWLGYAQVRTTRKLFSFDEEKRVRI